MKQLIEDIAKALVDIPEEVNVNVIEGEQTTVLELKVAPSDLGKVIGKQGRTARSIRTILGAAGMKLNRRFTLEDFRDQLKSLRKLGSLDSLLKMMPKVGMMKELQGMTPDENELTRIVAIIDSMTPRERDNHMIINGSRRRRIARGSGTTVNEVNNLLKQYGQARKMMKSLSGNMGFLGKKLGKLGMGKFGLPGGF